MIYMSEQITIFALSLPLTQLIMILFSILGFIVFGGFILVLVYIFVTIAYESWTDKVAPWRRRRLQARPKQKVKDR